MNSHLMQSLCLWIPGRTNFGSQNSTDFGVRNIVDGTRKSLWVEADAQLVAKGCSTAEPPGHSFVTCGANVPATVYAPGSKVAIAKASVK